MKGYRNDGRRLTNSRRIRRERPIVEAYSGRGGRGKGKSKGGR